MGLLSSVMTCTVSPPVARNYITQRMNILSISVTSIANGEVKTIRSTNVYLQYQTTFGCGMRTIYAAEYRNTYSFYIGSRVLYRWLKSRVL